MYKKFAIVTGASTGIGREIAIELSKNQYLVLLIGRSKKGLAETKKLITKANGQANLYICDLSDITEVNKLILYVKEKTKKVHAIINVAGIWHGKNEVYTDKDFETLSKKIILDTLTVGFISPVLITHALIPLMSKNSKIINISGTFENGAKGWLPYYLSKKGLEDFTVGLAEELKEKFIQVNAVSPSDTATEAYKKYFPQSIAECIEPEKIAKQVSYLCSSAANDITGKVFVMKKDIEPYSGYHT